MLVPSRSLYLPLFLLNKKSHSWVTLSKLMILSVIYILTISQPIVQDLCWFHSLIKMVLWEFKFCHLTPCPDICHCLFVGCSVKFKLLSQTTQRLPWSGSYSLLLPHVSPPHPLDRWSTEFEHHLCFLSVFRFTGCSSAWKILTLTLVSSSSAFLHFMILERRINLREIENE